MNDVVEEIFQYLDAESLQNAELTCKAWKAAASEVNHEKLWQVLLHNKVCVTLKRSSYTLEFLICLYFAF